MGKNLKPPKTKQCKFCKSVIDKNAKVCPFCQRAQKGSKGCLITSIIIFIVIVGTILAIAIPVTISVRNNSSDKTSSSQSAEAWKEFDGKSWKQFAELYQNHNSLMSAMTAYSDGVISASNFYSQCKTLRDNFRNISVNLNYGKNSEETAYLSVLNNWALSDQMAAEDLMDYVDTLKPSKLSSANENIQNAKAAVVTASSNRGVLLQKAGLSQSEIEQKVDKDLAELE